MENGNLSFLVVGAGAIGGITAALLKRSGADISIICRRESYADLITRTGISVSGVGGEFSVTVPAYASTSDVKEKKDIILLATKATEMIEAAESVKALMKHNSVLVSLQNGFCESALSDIVGVERIIGCVTGWGATMISEGIFEMTSKGDFIIGYPDREPDEFLSSLAEQLAAVVPVTVTDNITGHLYSKLIINSCITSLGAICGLYLGEMLSVGKIRRIFIEIIREAMAVADKMEIRVEVFGGRLDFRKFLGGKSMIAGLRRHMIIRLIGLRYKKLKSSSLQSLERGRLTEIDYLNGYIAGNGIRLNVSVSVNAFIVSMIHDIEQGRRIISLSNFNDPFFDRFN